MNRLEELVYLSIGRASMCWSEIPRGVFNEIEAKKVAEGLMVAIEKYVNEEIQHDRTVQHLTTPHIIKDANGNVVALRKEV